MILLMLVNIHVLSFHSSLINIICFLDTQRVTVCAHSVCSMQRRSPDVFTQLLHSFTRCHKVYVYG